MKKLLAIAVAAALTAPAAMADTTLYGKLHASVNSVKTTNGTTATSATDTSVNSNASRFGIKGATALDNGLEATYGLEYGIKLDGGEAGKVDGSSTTGLTARNTFVGLKGKFGEVRVGRHDTPAKLATSGLDVFADTAADMNSLITADNERVDNAVAYINKFGPVTVAAAHSTGAAPMDDAVETNSPAGFSDANSVLVNYSAGPWYAGLGHTTINGLRKNTNLGLGWKAEAGHAVNLVYETQKSGLANETGKDTNVLLNGVYKIGNVGLKAQVGEGKHKGETLASNNGKEKLTSVGVDYSLGKKTSAYLLWSENKNPNRKADTNLDKNTKTTTTAVGLVTEF